MPTGLTVFKGARKIATFAADLGDISDAAIAVRGNVIAWVGPSSLLPEEFANADEVSRSWVMNLEDHAACCRDKRPATASTACRQRDRCMSQTTLVLGRAG